MNRIVILVVPADRTPAEFEAALREHFARLESAPRAHGATRDSPQAGEPNPRLFWTWFLPNPCSPIKP